MWFPLSLSSYHYFGRLPGLVYLGTILTPVVNLLVRFNIHYTDILTHPRALSRLVGIGPELGGMNRFDF